jgi:hypothetical protein
LEFINITTIVFGIFIFLEVSFFVFSLPASLLSISFSSSAILESISFLMAACSLDSLDLALPEALAAAAGFSVFFSACFFGLFSFFEAVDFCCEDFLEADGLLASDFFYSGFFCSDSFLSVVFYANASSFLSFLADLVYFLALLSFLF